MAQVNSFHDIDQEPHLAGIHEKSGVGLYCMWGEADELDAFHATGSSPRVGRSGETAGERGVVYPYVEMVFGLGSF